MLARSANLAMDARYAYISTEMEGFIGNILVTYDIVDPRGPKEVSRWWVPGQHMSGSIFWSSAAEASRR